MAIKRLISVRLKEIDAIEIDAILKEDRKKKTDDEEPLTFSDVVREIIGKHFKNIRDLRELNSMQ